ncbi:MAG: helix-turn-helix domain-containing protein, partial [Propionivibrio sp.]
MRSRNDLSRSGKEEFGKFGEFASEININVEDAAPAMPPEVLSVGQQLRAAREANGLTAADISRGLKLSLNQVDALEADDWDRLPGKTFIRGFVRNYARLLGLDSDQLMSDLDGRIMPQSPELRVSAGTPVRFSQESKTDRNDSIRILSGVIILILAMLAYFLLPQDLWQSALTTIKNIGQAPTAVSKQGRA